MGMWVYLSGDRKALEPLVLRGTVWFVSSSSGLAPAT